MKLPTIYAFLIAMTILGGCSTIESLYTDVPKGIAEAQATLAAAEHTALIYASLPICGKTSAILCRDPSLTAKIKAADELAFDAVEAAYKAETQNALDAAITALGLLTSITNTLPAPTVTGI